MKKHNFLALLAFAVPVFIKAQFSIPDTTAKLVVEDFFIGLNSNDTNLLKPLLKPDAIFVTIDEKGLYEAQSVSDFLKSLARLQAVELEERTYAYTYRYSGAFAEISMSYDFYLNGEKHHCGINSFELIKQDKKWKIMRVVDTRIKECLPVNKKGMINRLIEDWHIAAATANENYYFSFLTDSAVFIGTDSTERWVKADFQKWAQPAFGKNVAWDFKATERNIRLNEAESMAWFDEQLNTHMGTCQATGVLSLGPTGWQLEHYQLSVTVPNSKIKDFVEMVYGK